MTISNFISGSEISNQKKNSEIAIQTSQSSHVLTTPKKNNTLTNNNKINQLEIDTTFMKNNSDKVFELLNRIMSIQEWIGSLINEKINLSPSYINHLLSNGVILCKLCKFISPEFMKNKKITDIEEASTIYNDDINKKINFKHFDNLNFYKSFIDYIGLPKMFQFDISDLYHYKNIPKVIYSLFALSHFLYKREIIYFTAEDIYTKFKQNFEFNFKDEDIIYAINSLKESNIKQLDFTKITRLLNNDTLLNKNMPLFLKKINSFLDQENKDDCMSYLEKYDPPLIPAFMIKHCKEKIYEQILSQYNINKQKKQDKNALKDYKNNDDLEITNKKNKTIIYLEYDDIMQITKEIGLNFFLNLLNIILNEKQIENQNQNIKKSVLSSLSLTNKTKKEDINQLIYLHLNFFQNIILIVERYISQYASILSISSINIISFNDFKEIINKINIENKYKEKYKKINSQIIKFQRIYRHYKQIKDFNEKNILCDSVITNEIDIPIIEKPNVDILISNNKTEVIKKETKKISISDLKINTHKDDIDNTHKDDIDNTNKDDIDDTKKDNIDDNNIEKETPSKKLLYFIYDNINNITRDQTEIDFELNINSLYAKMLEYIEKNEKIEYDNDQLENKISLVSKTHTSISDLSVNTYNEPETSLLSQISNHSEYRIGIDLIQRLFYMLQTTPDYLIQLLSVEKHVNIDFPEKILFSIFNHIQTPRDSYYFLKIIIKLIDNEIDKDILKLKENFSQFDKLKILKTLISYYKLSDNGLYLKETLYDIVNKIIINKNTLTLDPILIYKNYIDSIEITTGIPSTLPYDVDFITALNHDIVKKKFISTFDYNKLLIDLFFSIIKKNQNDISYGIKFTLNSIYKKLLNQNFNHDIIISKLCSIFFLHYISPVICNPEKFNILDTNEIKLLTNETQKNLISFKNFLSLITKNEIFNNLPIEFININIYINETHLKFRKLIEDLILCDNIDSYFIEIDEFSDVIMNKKLILNLKTNLLYMSLKTIEKNLNFLIDNNNNQFKTTIKSLFIDNKNFIVHLMKKLDDIIVSDKNHDSIIELKMINDYKIDKTQDKILYFKTKKLFMVVLSQYKIDSLTDFLNNYNLQKKKTMNKTNSKQIISSPLLSNYHINVNVFDFLNDLEKESNLSLEELIPRLIFNLNYLHDLNLISIENDYFDFLSDIVNSIKNENKIRMHYKSRIIKLEKNLDLILKKNSLLNNKYNSLNSKYINLTNKLITTQKTRRTSGIQRLFNSANIKQFETISAPLSLSSDVSSVIGDTRTSYPSILGKKFNNLSQHTNVLYKCNFKKLQKYNIIKSFTQHEFTNLSLQSIEFMYREPDIIRIYLLFESGASIIEFLSYSDLLQSFADNLIDIKLPTLTLNVLSITKLINKKLFNRDFKINKLKPIKDDFYTNF